MEKKNLPDYIHLIPACGYIFGYATTQSTQCSCVAGGSDEVAGWRWGFPALASARPWHCTGKKKKERKKPERGTRGQSVYLLHGRISSAASR